MRKAKAMKRDIELSDVAVDPGFTPPIPKRGAFIDYGREVAVDGNRETPLAHRAGKTPWKMEFVTCARLPDQWDQSPHIGIIEFDLAAVGAVGHWKDAERIGLDQRFG